VFLRVDGKSAYAWLEGAWDEIPHTEMRLSTRRSRWRLGIADIQSYKHEHLYISRRVSRDSAFAFSLGLASLLNRMSSLQERL
jgi:hypothetical protein